jgi:hypothetical protein
MVAVGANEPADKLLHRTLGPPLKKPGPKRKAG